MRTSHMLICVALVVAGVALLSAGAGAATALPLLGCMLMMGAMLWMMGRRGGGDGDR